MKPLNPGESDRDPAQNSGEQAIDPLQPVLTMPGMWHFTFGFIFALVSFVGGLVVLLGLAAIEPVLDILAVAIASLFTTTLAVLVTRGFKLAITVVLFCSLTPFIVMGDLIFLHKPMMPVVLVLSCFWFAAYLLLRSPAIQTLTDVLSERRLAIRKMKADGSDA